MTQIQIMDLGICPDHFMILSQITGQAAQANCVFPENSTPSCDNGNQNCGFTCADGFTASFNPPACVCNPPNVACNGQCQESSACPSSIALRKRRRVGTSCSEKGPGWAACGVYGGSSRAWECVNTARDLESCTCLSNPPLTLRMFISVILTVTFSLRVPTVLQKKGGGCAIPLTPYSPIGTDCSAIPGVADVACLYGECVVYRCLPGYENAHDGHSCVRKFSQFEEEDVPANVYGLEHVPLGGH